MSHAKSAKPRRMYRSTAVTLRALPRASHVNLAGVFTIMSGYNLAHYWSSRSAPMPHMIDRSVSKVGGRPKIPLPGGGHPSRSLPRPGVYPVESRVRDLALDIAQLSANVRQSVLNHVDIRSQSTFGMCSRLKSVYTREI